MRVDRKKVIVAGTIAVLIIAAVTGFVAVSGNSRKINSQIPMVVNYTDTEQMKNDLMKLTQLSLLTTDEQGDIIYKGTAADIEQKYYSADDITKITIKLSSKLKFSDGDDLTADDLVFSYYWLLNEESNRNSAVASLPLTGLDEYRFDSANASSMLPAARTELENPSDATKTLIADNVIKPFLTSQLEWAKSLYASGEDVELTGKFASAKDLFANLYAPKAKYNSLNDDETAVLAEVISEYGCDYDSLGYAYAGDYDYFENQALKQAFVTVSKSMDKGASVSKVSGIKKTSDSTVEITIKGYDASYVYDVCDIYIIPKHKYESTANVGKSIDYTIGAGMYTVKEISENEVKLIANSKYCGIEPLNTNLTITNNVDSNNVASNNAYTLSYETNSYCYVGFNVNTVNVNKEPLSQASCELRKNISKAFTGDSIADVKMNAAEYTIYIDADGIGNHPAMATVNEAIVKLAAAGIKLNVIDTSDESVMWEAVNSGKAQMWCGVWNEKRTPEFEQKYSSASINSYNASYNPYKINSPELDTMIKDYNLCKDNSKLSTKYTQMKSKIDAYAIEQILYKKTKTVSISPEPLNASSVFEKVSSNYDWINEIGNIKIAE